MGDTKSLSIRLPTSLADELEERAKRNQVNKSQLAREAVERYLHPDFIVPVDIVDRAQFIMVLLQEDIQGCKLESKVKQEVEELCNQIIDSQF